MTQTNLLELAKQGDPQAIATLMNRSLQPRGITADVELQGNCLRVALEAEQVPNRQALTAFVQNGIGNLAIQSIQSIKVTGRQIGASVPAWVHEIILDISDDALATDALATDALATDALATDAAIAEAPSSPEADVLPPAPPLPIRPTPPPAPPFRPASAPLVEEGDSSAADLPASPSANSALDFPESQFEELDLENLDLNDLEFEEFDDEESAPLSNADFGFPEDSELEEAIANDFGVSNSRSRGLSGDDDAFTNSLDDLGLGALADEFNADQPDQEAIAGDLNQLDQNAIDLNALEEFDFGDELTDSATAPDPLEEFNFGDDLTDSSTAPDPLEEFNFGDELTDSATAPDALEEFNFGDELTDSTTAPDALEPASETVNTDDLLASLDFEDGLDLEELDLTSDLNNLQPASETAPSIPTATDFEHDLGFEDDLAIGSKATTDPLADLDLEMAFDEDAFSLDSDLETNALADVFSDQFTDESDEILLDPLAALDLEEELGFEPINQVTGEAAPDPLAELEFEDDFQLDASLNEPSLDEPSLDETSLDETSWNLDEEPVSDSWLTEGVNAEISNTEPNSDALIPDDFNSEIPNAEIPNAEIPNAEISTDSAPPLAFTDEFNLADEPSPDPLDSLATYSPDYALEDPDPMAAISWDDDVSLAADPSESFPDPLSELDLPADLSTVNLPDVESSSFLDFSDLQDDLGQDDLGTVELVNSPDDELPPELLVDDIAMPSLSMPEEITAEGIMPDDAMSSFYPSPYDTADDSAIYSDENSAAEDEEVILDWMTEPIVEPSFDPFPEDDETNREETWGQDLVSEPTLDGFSAIAPLDYPDTAPADSPLVLDEEDQTGLVEGNYPFVESIESFQDFPDLNRQSDPFDAAAPPQLTNQTDESVYPVAEQGDSGWTWATAQTESDTMPAPGYFQSDEATSPDRSLLIEDADSSALSLEPTTGENLTWEADPEVESTLDSSSRSAPKSLISSVLLFLIGWVALLIGYSLWSNLTASPPTPAQPEVQQPLEVPPVNPSVAPVPPPVAPAEQIAPPPQP